MQYAEINQTTDYTNKSTNFLVLFSWSSAFTIQDQAGNAASGSILAYVATNSLVIIPPSYVMHSFSGVAYGVFMNQAELWQFLLS